MDNNTSGGGNAPGRGRGRPRASYAQTGELDLSLIREYRSRPSLYDRNSKRFHDKMFTAQQWQMISHKLGYDVSLLKDRMLQLRNRYNIERRRLDQWREDNNDDSIMSPWPLFDSLSFLSDHIRSRRSYKHLEKKDYNSDENFELMDEDDSTTTHVMATDADNNDILTDRETELMEKQGNHAAGENDVDEGVMAAEVKVEMEAPPTDDEFDANNEDAEQQLPVMTVLKTPAAKQPPIITYSRQNYTERSAAATAAAASTSLTNKTLFPPSITLRRVEGANGNKYIQALTPSQQQQQQQMQANNSTTGANLSNNSPSPNTSNISTGITATTTHATNAIPNNRRVIGTRTATRLQNSIAPQQAHAAIDTNDDAASLETTDQTSSTTLLPPTAKKARVSGAAAGTLKIAPPSASSTPNSKTTSSNSVSAGAGKATAAAATPNTSSAKFHAFGDFVGSALADLPAKKALRLVEKFTTELVQALIVHNNEQRGENTDSVGGVKLTNSSG